MDLRANAIITAIDRFSGPVRSMGGALDRLMSRSGAIGGRLNSLSGSFSKLSQAGQTGLGLGAPGMLGGALALQGEYQVDRVSRLMQSAGELTDQQRQMMKRAAFSASQLTGIGAPDVLEGQRALIQGGLDAQSTLRFTDTVAKVAKANGMSMGHVAEDAINVANALGYAMSNPDEKIASMTKVMEFMSVVPNLSTESWEGLRTSLKYAAPIAGMLKMEVTELGAALSVLADAGFKGEQAGTALRTSLVRIQAATPKARGELRAAGIDLDNLFSFDRGKLGDKVSLRERLMAGGLGNAQIIDSALKGMDIARHNSVYGYQDALIERLTRALGIGKGDAENRRILNAAIGQHIDVAKNSFDMERYFQGIAKLSAPAMKEIFGLQRIAQAEALRRELNKIIELPSGERLTRFRHLANQFKILMPGAIDRRFATVADGYAMAVDRLSGALGALRNAVFETQFGRDVTAGLSWLTSQLRALQSVDPSILRGVGTGLMAIAAIPVAGFLAIGASGFFSGLASLLATPGLPALLAAGGLYALLGGDLAAPFRAPAVDRLDSKDLGFGTPPIVETWTSIKALVGEVGGLLGDIGAKANEWINSLGSMMGMDVEGSLLVKGLKATNFVLDGMVANLKFWRENAPQMLGGKFTDLKPPGEEGSWWRRAWQHDMFKGLGGASKPDTGEGFRLLPTHVDVQGQATITSRVQVEFVNGIPQVVNPSDTTQQVPLRTGTSLGDIVAP